MDFTLNKETMQFEKRKQPYKAVTIECMTKKDYNSLLELMQRNKHGKWVCLEHEIGLYSCSCCSHNILRAKCNFCPHCGAKMDKE